MTKIYLKQFKQVSFYVTDETNPNLNMTYATAGSSGIDICSNEDLVILSKEDYNTDDFGNKLPIKNWKLIKTGLFYDSMPEELEIQVRSRSGLALKFGVSVAQGIGTLDADYKNEIGVILINNGIEPFKINKGDRIAQLVVAPVVKIGSSNTTRNGGFGSTGINSNGTINGGNN